MVALAYFGEGAHERPRLPHRPQLRRGARRSRWSSCAATTAGPSACRREQQTASETIAQKAIAYGMRGERVDGNDLFAVHDATRRARARAAAGEGPTLIECVTYRIEGHSTSDDPRVYRPAELVEPWKKKDPILRVRRYLVRRGALDDAADARLRDEAREEVQRAAARGGGVPAEAAGREPVRGRLRRAAPAAAGAARGAGGGDRRGPAGGEPAPLRRLSRGPECR